MQNVLNQLQNSDIISSAATSQTQLNVNLSDIRLVLPPGELDET